MNNWKGPDRRKGPDILVKFVRLSTLLSWLSFIVALVIFHYARPETPYGIVRYHSLEIRTHWLEPWSTWLMIGLWVCALLSLTSLLMNQSRNRRRQDKSRYNLLLLFMVTAGWIAYFRL